MQQSMQHIKLDPISQFTYRMITHLNQLLKLKAEIKIKINKYFQKKIINK